MTNESNSPIWHLILCLQIWQLVTFMAPKLPVKTAADNSPANCVIGPI